MISLPILSLAEFLPVSDIGAGWFMSSPFRFLASPDGGEGAGEGLGQTLGYVYMLCFRCEAVLALLLQSWWPDSSAPLSKERCVLFECIRRTWAADAMTNPLSDHGEGLMLLFVGFVGRCGA